MDQTKKSETKTPKPKIKKIGILEKSKK